MPTRLTVLAPFPPGCSPGQRFRFEQWLSLLPSSSLDVEVHSAFSRKAYGDLYSAGHYPTKAGHTARALSRRLRDMIDASKSDVVLIYREMFPLGRPVLERLLAHQTPFVMDFDDAIYLPGEGGQNDIMGRFRHPEKVAEIVRYSAHTTVGNRHLADYARQHASHVTVLPTTLDIERYRPHGRRSPVGRRLRIGWSGSFSTARHLQSLDGVLSRMLTDRGLELAVLGAPEYRLAAAPNVVVVPWSEASEQGEVAAFDIGIMPLPDDDYTRGKCGFKALLYMALGVPCVASPVGVNCEIIEHEVNGLLASTENEWMEAIGRLAADEALRKRLGEAGRETVVERYSGQRWSLEFLRILENVAQAA